MSVLTVSNSNFKTEVLESEKLVLLDFWAPWCGPCRMVSPIVDEVADELASSVKVGKVNVDDYPDLAAQFGVMSIPTLIVLKNGKVVNKSIGAVGKQAIVNMIQKS